MRIKFLDKLSGLTGCTSGNATILVAMGLPMLIGGAGLGVDLAQWYMWKRELQYAVDQAAVAGAWARAESATQNTYQARALQEFNANLSAIEGTTTAPVVTLASYAGGTNNSVIVHATAGRALPFSTMLTGAQPDIYAYAQASFQQGNSFTSCLIAVDPDADNAIIIGGSSVLTASCGLAALSDSDTAITVNGNPEIDAGWILAKGGIDQWLKDNTDDIIMEHMDGLYDPFAALTTPNLASANVTRSYSCSSATSASTKASIGTQLTTSYTYWKGSNSNNATSFPSYTPKKATVVGTTTTATNQTVANGTTAGSSSSSADTWTKLSGSGQNTVWEKKTVVTTTTYSNIVITPGTPAGAYLSPGTYTNLKTSCNTVFSSGVYVINGGTLDVAAQYNVTGSGVMFILKNGAGISINGGANVNLTAASASQLQAAGMSASDSNKYAGMLIFEDRASQGNTKNKINGNASTILNGTVYLPKSNIDFMGTAGVTSQCLMIASKTINITGNANMTTFCPAGSTEDTVVATMTSSVKLVA